MQPPQVLDSRESTNEHKTCQQPWEVGGVSGGAASFGQCLRSIEEADVEAGEAGHLRGRASCTNPLLVIAMCITTAAGARRRENANETNALLGPFRIPAQAGDWELRECARRRSHPLSFS